MHNRLSPKAHGFYYNVFMFYIDLDELSTLKNKLLLFSHNRFNFFSFKDVILIPLNKISPELGLSNVPKMVNNVVLPAPDEPTIETTSDGAICKSTPFKTSKEPYCFFMFLPIIIFS